MLIGNFIKFLDKEKDVSRKVRRRLNNEVRRESLKLKQAIQDCSPVDYGQYKANWRSRQSRVTNSETISSFAVENKGLNYAYPVTYGAPPGVYWDFPSDKDPSGKLTEEMGLVWAGGWDPGHMYTVGGVINNAVEDRNYFVGLIDNLTGTYLRNWNIR